jgi:ketosteroid isomerase-like protein
MRSNVDTVRAVTEALGRGDLLAVMGMVSKDVRWAVNAEDREAAPWFGVYQGKRSLPDFFAELAKLTFTDFTLKAILSDGDLVMTWLHVAFTSPLGRDVDMEEVQIWQLADGKVTSVDTLLDTAAVAAAFV